MIRDPSDGSVRHQQEPLETKDNLPEKPVLSTGASGLPIASAKPEHIERLERSREWLRKYRTDPEGTTRRMGEQGE